ncbi:MAG: SMP-30/gluconolactonase/LRE family protein [Neomegalonema sp.]|nr:SMP-30/gluconolactonase/LRE family protein [Neomegalonema sp.]
MTLAPSIDCVLAANARIGEAPVWSVAEQALFWVDIPAGMLHRFDPATQRDETWRFETQLGFCAPQADGALILALGGGFHRFERETGALHWLSAPAPQDYGHRFSEGAIDPRGRVYGGTSPAAGPMLEDKSGAAWRLTGEAQAARAITGFHTINGIAFAPDGQTAYASDSFPEVRAIWAWDYDLDSCAWTNRRLFFDTRAVKGRPDGAAIDSDGCYWMAGVSGWELVRLSPRGEIDMRVPFPVERPSKIAFGGPDLTTMYVTSISIDLTPGAEQPNAGGLFALSIPGVQGLATPAAILAD